MAPDPRPLEECRQLLAGFMDNFDPREWTGDGAAGLVRLFADLEKLVCAGKTLAAGRVEQTNGWRHSQHRSAEEWLAHETGTSVSSATRVMATASQMHDLPATQEAFRSGALSADQAAEVASAASADRASERRLLDGAGKESLTVLRRQAQAVRHAARRASGEEELARIHRSRYFRHWVASDGAVEGKFRLTPEAGAHLLAAVAAHRKTIFAEARRAGVRDESGAYEADALVAMAKSATSGDGNSGGGPRAVINVRVDRAALLRGHAEAGEVCEIDGIGPVPVATVKAAAHDAILRALLVDGDKVIDAKAAGRNVTAGQRRAIAERDRYCVVPGCDQERQLQIHHLVAVEDLGPTVLENLGKVCPWHHDQITHRGATLTGPYPDWVYQPAPPPPPAPPAPGQATLLG